MSKNCYINYYLFGFLCSTSSFIILFVFFFFGEACGRVVVDLVLLHQLVYCGLCLCTVQKDLVWSFVWSRHCLQIFKTCKRGCIQRIYRWSPCEVLVVVTCRLCFLHLMVKVVGALCTRTGACLHWDFNIQGSLVSVASDVVLCGQCGAPAARALHHSWLVWFPVWIMNIQIKMFFSLSIKQALSMLALY